MINNIKFCNDDGITEDCHDCPNNGRCSSGVLVGCKRGYTLVSRDLCLKRDKLDTLLYKMYMLAFQFVAEANTEKLCNQKCNYNLLSDLIIINIQVVYSAANKTLYNIFLKIYHSYISNPNN